MISAQMISDRVRAEFLERPIMDNALRGYWCEALIAEALGTDCRIVSGGWHPWDLQIGPDNKAFPERIRLQVKNSAARQSWHSPDDPPSEALFSLTWRATPAHMVTTEIPCEDQGFLCEIFVLCHHPISDCAANQTDPHQWDQGDRI